MNEIESYLQRLFTAYQITTPANRTAFFDAFAKDPLHARAVKQILDNQKMLVDKWKLLNRINDIKEEPLSVPNATVGKSYTALIDFEKLNWTDIVYAEWVGLTEVGLAYRDNKITGIPTKSGDLRIIFKFRLQAEPADTELHQKQIPLIINPDPKSLWKNIPSDASAPYWKKDEVTHTARLGDKNLVAASKRGRSHANAGSFREDDFACTYLPATGWSIITVADGAGSAPLSRQGSALACQAVINYFTANLNQTNLAPFDALIETFQTQRTVALSQQINDFVYNLLSQAVLAVHKKLEQFAIITGAPLKDFHSTLIFTLFKKYASGYVVLSFGVGDCPIGLISKNLADVYLLNRLDVGEFGGGTRFITMPEIFNQDNFKGRFGFKLVEDFAYLMLMTDGIYDPKFVVEANLEKPEKWQEFLADLNGKNAEGAKVDFKPENAKAENQLAAWMDFWSPGNHDDRTLVVIF